MTQKKRSFTLTISVDHTFKNFSGNDQKEKKEQRAKVTAKAFKMSFYSHKNIVHIEKATG